MAELAQLEDQIVLAHFIVSDDVERSRLSTPRSWAARSFSRTT